MLSAHIVVGVDILVLDHVASFLVQLSPSLVPSHPSLALGLDRMLCGILGAWQDNLGSRIQSKVRHPWLRWLRFIPDLIGGILFVLLGPGESVRPLEFIEEYHFPFWLNYIRLELKVNEKSLKFEFKIIIWAL